MNTTTKLSSQPSTTSLDQQKQHASSKRNLVFEKHDRFRTGHHDHIRNWSELYSLCLNEPDCTSTDLAKLSANELSKQSTPGNDRIMRLNTIAYRQKMTWTVDQQIESGNTHIARMQHDLFMIYIRMNISTSTVEDVYLVHKVNKSSLSNKINCEPMLKCLKLDDYKTFEQHIEGYVALFKGDVALFEAERILSDACRAERKSKSNYWDLFKEPLGHLCPRFGGIPPKFFYFLSPELFIKHCMYSNKSLDDVLQSQGHFFTLNVRGGELFVELHPELPASVNAFHEFPNTEHTGKIPKCSLYKTLDADGDITVKVNQPELRLYRYIQLHSINQIAHMIRLLRVQAFLYESLNNIATVLNVATNSTAETTLFNDRRRLMKITYDCDGILDISLPPSKFVFHYVRINFDGRFINIDDSDSDKLELIFNRVPSILSILYYLRSRFNSIENDVEDLNMQYYPVGSENEVSLNAVFNSVIERFTSRTVSAKTKSSINHEDSPQHFTEPDAKQQSGDLIERKSSVVSVTNVDKIDEPINDDKQVKHIDNDLHQFNFPSARFQKQQTFDQHHNEDLISDAVLSSVKQEPISKESEHLPIDSAQNSSSGISLPVEAVGEPGVCSTTINCNEVVKKKKGRKPKIERTLSNNCGVKQMENKRVEPLRIKLSTLSAAHTKLSKSSMVPKKKAGRKRLADKKIEEASKNLDIRTQSFEYTKIDSLNQFDILNKNTSSLNNFKIPRKKLQQSELLDSVQISNSNPNLSQFQSQGLLADPVSVPPSVFRMPSNMGVNRSSSLSPHVQTPTRRVFPPFQRASDIIQPVRHSAFPTNIQRLQLDPRIPPSTATRYRFIRNQHPSSTPNEFRYR
ncbi:hypothetical protein GJ496_008763 [Pomphorhynchus laevis]|nr:hypothetical protein GJ496_008763 [Pomphorhynchus laevis]